MDVMLSPKAARGLLAIVLVNLVWNFGISWCLRSEDIGWALVLVALLIVAIGTLVAQTFVLSVWISFSEGRWLFRWGIPALLLIFLATACGLGAGASGLGAAGAALPLAVLLCMLVALLIPLRRVRGWRLTTRQDAVPGELGRFRISDLLIWMVVIAAPLAIIRLFASLLSNQDIPTGMRAIAMLVLLLLPLLWLALLAAFAPRGWRHTWLLAGGIVAYAVVAIVLGAYFIFPWLEPLLWPLPGWIVLSITAAFFVSGPLVVSLNCLALRMLGWHLVRPGWSMNRPPPEQSARNHIDSMDNKAPTIGRGECPVDVDPRTRPRHRKRFA